MDHLEHDLRRLLDSERWALPYDGAMVTRVREGAARRRRGRRAGAIAGLAMAATVAVLVTVSALGPAPEQAGPVTPPTGESGRIELPGAAVDFYQDDMDVQQSWLFNPESGRYEVVDHILIDASPDLRYAMVTGEVPCDGDTGQVCHSYGRYDAATGEVQWYGLESDSGRYGFGQWSPDGSTFAFVRARIDQQDFQYITDFLFVDIQTGQRHLVPLREPDGWTAQDLVGWTADGQYLIVAARPAGTLNSLGADLLYRPDGSLAAIHEWPPGGKTWQALKVLGTNLIARMPQPEAAEPVEIRDATTGAVVAAYSHEQMLRTEMVVGRWGPTTTMLVGWISDHELVGQRGFNTVLVADLRTGVVRTVAEIPGDGGFIHLAPAG